MTDKLNSPFVSPQMVGINAWQNPPPEAPVEKSTGLVRGSTSPNLGGYPVEAITFSDYSTAFLKYRALNDDAHRWLEFVKAYRAVLG